VQINDPSGKASFAAGRRRELDAILWELVALPSVVLFRRTVKLKPICRDAQSDAVAGHRVAGAYRAVLRTKFPVSPKLSRHSAAEAVYVVASFFSTHPCQAQLLGYQLVDHPLRQKSWQSPVFKTLRNDRVACFRSLGRERDVHSFA
jgi:hypothetical protein